MKNTLNQIINSLAILILALVIIALFYGSSRITGASFFSLSSGYVPQKPEGFSFLNVVVLSLILFIYLFFKLYFIIRENPKRDFNNLKRKTMKFIEREHHDKAFEHYGKLKKEFEKFFEK